MFQNRAFLFSIAFFALLQIGCSNEKFNSTAASNSNSVGSQSMPPVDGACGSSNGLSMLAAPSVDLCSAGTASTVTSKGQYNWTCNGTFGGKTALCSAQIMANGACGAANTVSTQLAPAANLCASGMASSVSGSDPFSWQCQGVNGGTSSMCSAPLLVNGACGTANNTPVYQAPASNLCTMGTASAVAGTGPFTWSCTGKNGGTTSMCSAPLIVNGQCGTANGSNVTSAPNTNLCLAGMATPVAGSGPYTWTCDGLNGGTNMSCQANLTVNGKCGTANNTPYAQAPATGLCTMGMASAVASSPNGPFTWTCSGVYGGTSMMCSSPLISNGQCGSANMVAVGSAPTTNLCNVGTATPVTGSGPFTWMCSGTNGGTASSCSAPLAGVCGSANGIGVTSAPTANLCAAGMASTVTGSGPFNWTCTNNGVAAQCSAPLREAAACGSANGMNFTTAPATNLCSVGTASTVTGNGPFTWTCAGIGGGSNASCSAGYCLASSQPATTLPTGVTQAMISSICPAAGQDSQCGLVIIITNGGEYLYATGQGPFDGNDDTLVGVLNLTGIAVNSIGLSSTLDIMGFDGDGIASYVNGASNAMDTTKYGGPNAYFSNINGASTAGTVNFITPVAPNGGSTYFALENSLSSSSVCLSSKN